MSDLLILFCMHQSAARLQKKCRQGCFKNVKQGSFLCQQDKTLHLLFHINFWLSFFLSAWKWSATHHSMRQSNCSCSPKTSRFVYYLTSVQRDAHLEHLICGHLSSTYILGMHVHLLTQVNSLSLIIKDLLKMSAILQNIVKWSGISLTHYFQFWTVKEALS